MVNLEKLEELFQTELGRLKDNQERLASFYRKIDEIKAIVEKEESKTQEIIDTLEDFKTEVMEILMDMLEERDAVCKETISQLEKRVTALEKDVEGGEDGEDGEDSPGGAEYGKGS